MNFEELYRQYYKIVYGYLFTLCKNESLCEELTAETFFRAFQSYRQYDGKHKVSSWLCQIAKNEYFKYYNKHKRLKYLEETDDIPDCSEFEQVLIDKSTAIKLHKLLHKLSEPYKEVFILRVFAELSFAEIAAVLEKTENWARVTYYRAKIKLLQQMEDENG